MNNVLVTGANGFIGRHTLGPLLACGYTVHGAGRIKPKYLALGVEWHQVDLLNGSEIIQLLEVIQPTHLLHCAWCTTPGTYWTSLENFRWVTATLELVQQFRDHGGQRIVVAGSCAEYDWSYGYCSEKVTPVGSQTTYGTCKAATQNLLSAYSKETGLSYAWGRIFFPYGPHEHPRRLVASVIRALLRSEQARCTVGTQQRDFVHVQDVANALVAVLMSEIEGTVNIGTGKPIAVRDLVLTLGAMLDRVDLLQFGAVPLPEGEPPLLCADVRRLTEEAQWFPHYTLEDGLTDTIRWWREQEGEHDG